MWTPGQIPMRRLRDAVLLAEATGAALLMLLLPLWGLLTALGDETGAAAARMLAIAGGIGLGLLQILLLHLLALRPVAVKMESEREA